MNSKIKIVIWLVVFVAIIGIAAFAYQLLADRVNPIDINNKNSQQTKEKMLAPDFTVIDKDGNKQKLSDFKGKPIVLNFWASWCPPCKSEMPHFNKIYNEEKDEVVFMMVDLVNGQRETVESGKKYIEDNDYSFPVYFDTTQEAGDTYGISSIPSTLFIDKDGYVVVAYQGAMIESTLVTTIQQIK